MSRPVYFSIFWHVLVGDNKSSTLATGSRGTDFLVYSLGGWASKPTIAGNGSVRSVRRSTVELTVDVDEV